MRIRFTYNGSRRSGELEAFYTAKNGNLIAKVLEAGEEHPKSFQVAKMGKIESGQRLTTEELLPALEAAAADLAARAPRHEFYGHPLQLLLGLAYNEGGSSEAVDAIVTAEEATQSYMRGLGGLGDA